MDFGFTGWRRALRLSLCCFVLIGAGRPSVAGVVWVVLQDGDWRIFYQSDRGSPLQGFDEAAHQDASSPALSPDGSQVAFEVQGQGILVCPTQGEAACRTVRPESGSAARPAWNPANGELVFVRYVIDAKGEDSDIFTTTEKLSKISPLLSQTGNQDDPDVSPDGRFLVYSSAQTLSLHRAGVQVVRQLWVLDLETGRARPLAPGASQDFHPDWSPSGQEIAFASDRGGELDVWVVRADGSGLRQVTSGEGSKTWPAWSPDGREILFTLAKDGRQGLWLIGADGSNLRSFEPFGAGSDVQLRDADWR